MAGDIDMGHARALLALDRAAQITAGNQIAAKKLSVREAEKPGQEDRRRVQPGAAKPKKEKSRDMKRVEEELPDLLMAAEVKCASKTREAGRAHGNMGDPIWLAGRTQPA